MDFNEGDEDEARGVEAEVQNEEDDNASVNNVGDVPASIAKKAAFAENHGRKSLSQLLAVEISSSLRDTSADFLEGRNACLSRTDSDTHLQRRVSVQEYLQSD